MHCSIDFDDETFFDTEKINNEFSKRNLAPEFVSIYPMSTKRIP